MVVNRQHRVVQRGVPTQAPDSNEAGGQWPALMMARPSIANDGGDFYDQIHSEIKDLRSRVDVRLKDVVSRGESELDFLTEQLDALKILETDEGMMDFAAQMGASHKPNKSVPDSPMGDMTDGGNSFEDLKISSSAATEPATNRRQIAVARRLHKINFPDDATLADSDDETEDSGKRGYVFQNSLIMDQPHDVSQKDAVAKARALASPHYGRFFPDNESTERNKTKSQGIVDQSTDRGAIVPVQSAMSPYADQLRQSVTPSTGRQFRNAHTRSLNKRTASGSSIPMLSKDVPSLFDDMDSPRSPQSRELEPPDSRVLICRDAVSDPYGVDNVVKVSPSRSDRFSPMSSKSYKDIRHRDLHLDELMSSLDYLDNPPDGRTGAQTNRLRSGTRIAPFENSDVYSAAASSAMSAAQSVASQSIAYKAMNLQSLAHCSVTDSMALHSESDILASMTAGKANGVVRIEKVQGRALCDPYGDRGRYTGILVKEKPYGHGTMHYDDGRSYTGDWKNGRWQGKGRTLFVNGDFYVGEYVKDQRHGLGRYEWSDGRVYDGQFIRDRREGKGTYTWPDGAIYAGDFRVGHRHGQGCYKFPDGSVYTGEFKDGKYHGVGECIWADGRWYRGEWADGHAHGYGVEVRPDGSIRHDGEWKCDRPVRNGKELKERNTQEPSRRKNKIPEGDRPKRKMGGPPSPGVKSKYIYQIDP